MSEKKVAIVTGASSGIGEATARQLIEDGFVVYGAARRVERMNELEKLGVRALALDVTDDQSIEAAVNEVVARSGRVDVLVNNAGYGSYGAVEDVPLAEARRQFDVNVFGAIAFTQRILPLMRKQKSGTIVNISSMGGRIYTPMGAWYHGTKFAIEGISDSLRLEVEPFGIDVVLIEPGGISTEWSGIAAQKLQETSSGGAYATQSNAVAAALTSETNRKRESSPEVVAKAISKAVKARKPKTRYAVGFAAKPLIFFHTILPNRMFDRLIRRGVSGGTA